MKQNRSRKPGVPGVRINKSSIETAGVAALHTATPNRLRRQVLDSLETFEYGSGTLLGRYGGEKI